MVADCLQADPKPATNVAKHAGSHQVESQPFGQRVPIVSARSELQGGAEKVLFALDANCGCVGSKLVCWQAQLLVVAETREMVLAYAEAFKVLAQDLAPLEVYGAFSGKLPLDERQVDESSYNKDINGPEPHKQLGFLCHLVLVEKQMQHIDILFG